MLGQNRTGWSLYFCFPRVAGGSPISRLPQWLSKQAYEGIPESTEPLLGQLIGVRYILDDPGLLVATRLPSPEGFRFPSSGDMVGE